MSEHREDLYAISSESERQQASVTAAVKLSEYVTTHYPQIDDTDKTALHLNYYFTGSIAATLLARAEAIDICEETTGSTIRSSQTMQVPAETREALVKFARPIGDIDYVTTDHYDRLRQDVQESYGTITADEYKRRRAQYLWKGEGGPSFDELPEDALGALRRGENAIKVMCDSVEVYGTRKFARIAIDGRTYYVARPDTIIGYKILHMLQSYDQKPDRFNTDFATLHQAMAGLYSEDELTRSTHQILGEYETHVKPDLPAMIRDLLAKPDLGYDVRSFMERVVVYDQHHGQL